MRKIPGEKRRSRGGLVGVSTAVTSALAKLGEQGPDLVAASRIWNAWSTIVGKNMERHLRPVRVEKHVLTIETSSSGWLNEARFLEGAILANIAREVPKVTIEQLKFQLARGRKAKAWSTTPVVEPTPVEELAKVELDAQTQAAIEEAVSKLEEGPLRESARRALVLCRKAELARSRAKTGSN